MGKADENGVLTGAYRTLLAAEKELEGKVVVELDPEVCVHPCARKGEHTYACMH